jgi:hypothetical protein
MAETWNNHFFFQFSQSSNGDTVWGVFVENSWYSKVCQFPLLDFVWWSFPGFLAAFPAVAAMLLIASQPHLSKESSERGEKCAEGDSSIRHS